MKLNVPFLGLIRASLFYQQWENDLLKTILQIVTKSQPDLNKEIPEHNAWSFTSVGAFPTEFVPF